MIALLARTAVVAIFVGVMAGLTAPKGATATNYSVHIQLWPGGGTSLTCGWHGGACYDNDASVVSGPALDWAPSGTISFRAKSSTDSPSFSVSGVAYLTSQSQGGCSHTMYASISDNMSDWRAGVWYLHTDDSLSTFSQNINTQQYNLVWTTKAIGTTADEDGCSTWTGEHVHQMSDGGWILYNYPDHTTCNVDEAPVTNNVSDCWVSNSYYLGYNDWSVAYP